MAGPQFKNSESLNNSFEIHNSGKINSSDDENSGQDSCSSLQTLGNERIQHSELSKTGLKPINKYQHTRIKQSKGLSSKIINESNLPKVNWIIGFEEASSRNLFEWLWICTEKLNKIVKKKYKNLIQRYEQKALRDLKIQEMLPEDGMTQEDYFKKKSVQITSVVSTTLKNAEIIGNPIQSMMSRNIRHFENISYLKFENKKNKRHNKEKSPDELFLKLEKASNEAKMILRQVSKYKRVNNSILAFGFTERTKEIFSKAENEKEELENDEEFDLLKWFFGWKNVPSAI